MPTGYQIKDQSSIYYMTLQVVHWADIFTRKIYRDIVIESLEYCRVNKGLEVFAFVIMSNHLHLVVRSKTDDLSNTLRDFKRHTSKQILDTIQSSNESRKEWLLMIFRYAARQHKRNNEYQFWTHENHAVVLENNVQIDNCIDYIHNNPVEACLVQNAEDYLYSSARSFAGLSAVLKLDEL